ncbi:MAG: right-handed parallel beta-helix repeat-containing protein, partial [Acidobacteria bacterium]|nr:right-handed parallel beta-helix repeat-containing protein [Acidobacteriota bacterium]
MENRYCSSGKPSAFLSISGLLTLAFMAIFAASPASAQFFQGFETDNVWSDPPTNPTRVASGTNGIPSRSGGFHGEVVGAGIGEFTRWGGYSSVFPTNGYITSVAVYLDMGGAYANDTRFNWSSAINNPGGAHRRDFIFHGGYYNDAGPFGSGPRFVFSVSNNSPGNPRGGSPVVVTATGWYKMRHKFYNSGGGQLAVQMDLLDPSNAVVGTWTLSDASDIIGTTVGGNRYGWFPTASGAFQFPFLAIDDSEMAPNYRWVDTDGTAGPDDCDGSDAAHTTIQAAVTAAASGETIRVCAGSYTENVTVPAGKNNLTILGANAGISAHPGHGVRGPESIINGSVILGVSPSPSSTGNTFDGFEVQSGASDAVMVRGSGHTVSNNILNGQVVFPTSGTSAGIKTANTAGVLPLSFNLNNNSVSGYRHGIFIDGSAVALDASGVSSVITGNYSTNNERGISTAGAGVHGGTIIHQTTNNTVTGNDRGIRLAGGQFTVSGNVITNNTGVGGFGIHAGVGTSALNALTITSNYISGNPTFGILLEGNAGSPTITYNRIVGNGTGIGLVALPGTVNAENNWWGCNYGPGAAGAGCAATTNGVTGAVDADPWLTLTTSAAPSFVTVGGNATVTSPLTINSNNVDTSGGGNIPNGTPASFGATLGTVLPTSSTTTSGVASTVFTAGMTEGVGSASTTVDGQTVGENIPIYNATCAQVSMPNLTTLTGVGITVPITTDLMTGRDAISADFTVTYNPAVLTYSGVSLGPVAGSAAYNVFHTPGTIVVSIYGADEFTGSGVLANLNFSNVPGLPNDVSPMNFTSFMYNEGTPCDTNVNGSVTVIGGTITGNVTYGNALAPGPAPRYINNVTITGSGSMPVVSTTTDTNGDYSLSGFGPGTYTRTPSKTDVTSGSVTAFDASLISQHVVGLISLVGNQLTVADVSEAGGITSFDAALIARYTVSLAPFGVTGQWRFTPASNGPSPVYTNLTENYVGLLMGDVSGNWGQVTAYFTGLPAPGSRQDEARPAMVKAPVITANPDSVFEVPVTIRGAAGRGVVAYNFELSYDPNVVRPL